MRKIRRIKDKGWLGGVCAGIAYSLNIPTWIVRMAFVILIILDGVSLDYGIEIIAYILFWIFLPKWKKLPEDYKRINE